MARATVVLDPLFKRVGLSGKSVIPFIVGTGCSVPGVMSARTIHNERERNATVMLAPFMPCGAKLPVIALFSGAFFGDASWVGTLMYFVGIALILVGALLVNKITGSRRKSYFIMELPEYKFPSIKRATQSMLSRGWSFVAKAGTVILLCNTIVYLMQTFSWQFRPVDAAESSILATIAQPIAILLIPIGAGVWQMAAAAVTGFVAKENVVGTLALCYGLSNLLDADGALSADGGNEQLATAMAITKVAALAFLIFNLFTPPCFAAIGSMHAEMSNGKWFWGGIALQLGTGYALSFLVYQIGTLITTGQVGAGFWPGLVAVVAMVVVVILLCIRADIKAKKDIQKN